MFSGYCEKKSRTLKKSYKDNNKKYNTDFLYSTRTATVKQPLFLRFTKLLTLYVENLRTDFRDKFVPETTLASINCSYQGNIMESLRNSMKCANFLTISK